MTAPTPEAVRAAVEALDSQIALTQPGSMSVVLPCSLARTLLAALREREAAVAQAVAAEREKVERLTVEVGEQVALGRKLMDRADALEPVVRFALADVRAYHELRATEDGWEYPGAYLDLVRAVDALPEEMRKEFE